METSWRQYQIRMSMPPDAWQALDDALTLAREACLANGSTWDERNPWQLFQAIAIESQEGLRAAVPAPSCVPA